MHGVSRSAGALLGFLALAACAETGSADFDRRMATFVSGSEGQLVSTLGVPERVYEADGRRFLQYSFAGQSSSPTVSPGIGIGIGGGRWGSGVGVGTGIGFGFGGGGYQPEPCIATFEVRNERVLDFQRQGTGCR